MTAPVGYVTVSEISFWLAEIFNKKWDTIKGSLPPWLRNSPELLDAFDAEIDGEQRGTIRRLLLLTCLKEKIENLYLCRPDLTVVRAGPYILETYESPSTMQIERWFLDGEYRHIGVQDFLLKSLRYKLADDMSDETRQALTEKIKELEQNPLMQNPLVQNLLMQNPLAPSFFSCIVDDFAEGLASAGQQAPELSNKYSFDESLSNSRGALRGVFGDLAGAHLVVTDADAQAIQDALTDELDPLLLEISKGFMARVNATALRLKINLPGASIPKAILADRIIEEIEKTESAKETVRKNDILDRLHKRGLGTYRALSKAWSAAVSKSGRSDLSKPGRKKNPPK